MSVAVMFTIDSNAQEKYIGLGLGLSVSNVDAGEASNCGIKFDIDLNKIHMDFAGNMAGGSGEYLEFTSSETYSVNKKLWLAYNFGYNFLFIKDEMIKYIITPKFGIISTKEILEDPIGATTHCFGEKETKCQIAVDFGLRMNDILVKVGVGSIESFSFSLSWVISYYQ